MRNDKDVLKTSFIKRRSAIIAIGYIFLLFVLVVKLFKMQVINGLLYRRRARNNFLREEFSLPKRGTIFDRNGDKMAFSVRRDKVVYFAQKKDNEKNIRHCFEVLRRRDKVDEICHRVLKGIKRGEKKFVIAKDLNREEYTRFKFNLVYFNGLELEDYYVRKYLFRDATSPLVGFVAGIRNTNSKIARQNFDYRVGISGCEKVAEDKLGGKVGMKYNVINAVGKKVDEISVNTAVDGKDMTLSIDQRLQSVLAELMEDKNGACTLLDVKTGEILAMHSTPNIDPNYLSVGVDDEEWTRINRRIADNSGIFLNKNISATYPPGSTFKVISALTALKNGFDPYKKFNCTGEYKIGNRVFHCWIAQTARKQHGLVDMNTAIAQSCNCYFYHLSRQVDCDDMYEMAKKFGLGEKHLLDFESELSGFVPNKRWKKKKYNQIWMPGDNANMALGQGYLNLTPLQLAIMMARLATNKEVEPEYIFGKKRIFEDLGIKEEHMNIVRRGLFSVLNEPYGIVYGMASKKYQICGKTGSAQVVSQRIENKDMRSGLVAKEKHSHALFVGFAPYNNPRFAVSVVVEHGIGGARSAAPIGTRLLAGAMDLYKE